MHKFEDFSALLLKACAGETGVIERSFFAYTIIMKRIPIGVIELCDEDGELTPMFVVKDGKRYAIDTVMSVRRHAPGVECVSPLRYDCIIEGRKKTIYRDAYPSGKWFSVVQ